MCLLSCICVFSKSIEQQCTGFQPYIQGIIHAEPVYAGWSSLHENAIWMPLVDTLHTWISLGGTSECLQGALEHH